MESKMYEDFYLDYGGFRWAGDNICTETYHHLNKTKYRLKSKNLDWETIKLQELSLLDFKKEMVKNTIKSLGL